MRKMSIRKKIILLFLSIFLISMFLFLYITQKSVLDGGKNAIEAIEKLKVEASEESGEQLKSQANLYLNKLVKSQAANSNYIFKNIEAQINLAHDYSVSLWNSQEGAVNKNSEVKNLANHKSDSELIENPGLDFYYSLAPKVKESEVKNEIELLSNLSTVFKSIVKNNKELAILPLSIDGVYIGTESGVFYNMTWLAYYNKDYDPRKRPWYISAKKSKELNWSDLYVDVASDDYLVTVSKPCYDEKGNFKGVIGIDVNINAMIDIITTQISDIGEALLVNKEGQIITYESLTPELKNMFGNQKDLSKTNNDNLKKIANEIKSGGEGVKEIQFEKTSKLIGYSSIESTDWSLVFVGSTDEIMKYVNQSKKEIEEAGKTVQSLSQKSVKKTIQYTLIVFGIILVLTILLLVRFSRLITDPLSKLTNKVKKIGDGNLEETIDIKTGDEIEILADSFNEMLSDLKTYIKNLKETTAAKEKMESELAISHKIQASMLPRIFPPFPERDEFKIFGTMRPTKEVGGDFFDFYFIDDDKFCFTIADVSGKGIPAALFMVISKVILRNESQKFDNIDEVFNNANNKIVSQNDELLFVTVFSGIIDLKTGEVEFVNAGHNPPLICKAGSDNFEYLELNKGFVLGGMPDFKYVKQHLKMDPGDILYMYTDGVNEAMDVNDNQYSEKRLKDKLDNIGTKDITEIENKITTDLKMFTKGAKQSDDVTMLIFKYEGKE
ncbi:MAG: SpoIIE family protein phosphatase [Fusobacteriota bacterium]